MLAVPFLQENGELYIDIYTYDDQDFSKVKTVLENAGITPEAHDMDNPGKRNDKRFIINQGDKEKLEKYLRAQFDKTLHRTVVEFDSEGQPYHCVGKDEDGNEVSSVEFLANNENVAALKAGLVANNNRWYDGVATMKEKAHH